MKLPKISIPNPEKYGFTLIEVIVVMAMLGLLSLLGLAISFDSYQRYNFRAEKSLVQNILQKARSQAIGNIDQLPHGFHISGDFYTLYEGSSWIGRNANKDLAFPRGSGISTSGSGDIIFRPLTGSCNTLGSFTIASKNSQAVFSINQTGQINVQ
jgi:prepilin-type N-terminal cleavage/methylation domain-containing protein